MEYGRLRLGILFLGLALVGWPGMMLFHEAGHILAAIISGGQITELIWHPLAFSRTDVSPNPAPHFVVWLGPIVGCILPLVLDQMIGWARPFCRYMTQLFAGFCLIANGAYIGLGHFDRVGDTGQMLRLGTPVWVMILFGTVATGLGLFYWHLAVLQMRRHPLIVARRSHLVAVIVLGLTINALAIVTS